MFIKFLPGETQAICLLFPLELLESSKISKLFCDKIVEKVQVTTNCISKEQLPLYYWVHNEIMDTVMVSKVTWSRFL